MTYFEWIDSEHGEREEKITILMQLFSCTRSFLFARGKQSMPADIGRQAEEILARRLAGMPLQYAIGHWCFFGRNFYIGEGVLIPRPETELLVDLVLKSVNEFTVKVWDVCAGSGAIGLTLAKERPQWQVLLSDISNEALFYAKKNLQTLEIKNAQVRCGDLFSVSSEDDYDVIVSNPPYIRRDVISTLSPEVRDYEPVAALDGGEDGLYFYRKLFSEAKNHLKKGGKVFFEIGYDQGEEVSSLAQMHGYREIRLFRDFSGLHRIIAAERG